MVLLSGKVLHTLIKFALLIGAISNPLNERSITVCTEPATLSYRLTSIVNVYLVSRDLALPN